MANRRTTQETPAVKLEDTPSGLWRKLIANEPIPPRRSIYMPRGFWPLLDFGLVFAAFALAYYLRYKLQLVLPVDEANRATFLPYLPYAAVFGVLLILNYQGSGLYRNIRGRTWMEEVNIVFNGVTNATVVVLGIYFLFMPLVFSRLLLFYVAVITIVLLSMVRLVRRWAHAYLRSKGIGVQRVLVVGAGDVGMAVL